MKKTLETIVEGDPVFNSKGVRCGTTLPKGVRSERILAKRIAPEIAESGKRVSGGEALPIRASFAGVVSPYLPILALGLGPVFHHGFVPAGRIKTHNGGPGSVRRWLLSGRSTGSPPGFVQCTKTR